MQVNVHPEGMGGSGWSQAVNDGGGQPPVQPPAPIQTQQPRNERSVVDRGIWYGTKNKKRNGGLCCLVLVYIILVLVFAPWETTSKCILIEKETMLLEASNTWWKRIDVYLSVGNSDPPLVGRVAVTPQYTDEMREVGYTLDYEHIPAFGYEELRYYLNSGSTIEVSWNMTSPVDFYLIKSVKEKDLLENGSSFTYLRHVAEQNTYSFSYQTGDDSADFYYLVFEAGLTSASGLVIPTVRLATYDFAYTDPRTRCTVAGHGLCDMDLDRSGDTHSVLIDMQDIERETYVISSVTYHGRHEFYFSVFLGPLGCVLVLVSLLKCIKYKRKKAAQFQPVSAPTAGYSSM